MDVNFKDVCGNSTTAKIPLDAKISDVCIILSKSLGVSPNQIFIISPNGGKNFYQNGDNFLQALFENPDYFVYSNQIPNRQKSGILLSKSISSELISTIRNSKIWNPNHLVYKEYNHALKSVPPNFQSLVDDIAQLGFPIEDIKECLRSCRYDRQYAINMLLSQNGENDEDFRADSRGIFFRGAPNSFAWRATPANYRYGSANFYARNIPFGSNYSAWSNAGAAAPFGGAKWAKSGGQQGVKFAEAGIKNQEKPGQGKINNGNSSSHFANYGGGSTGNNPFGNQFASSKNGKSANKFSTNNKSDSQKSGSSGSYYSSYYNSNSQTKSGNSSAKNQNKQSNSGNETNDQNQNGSSSSYYSSYYSTPFGATNKSDSQKSGSGGSYYSSYYNSNSQTKSGNSSAKNQNKQSNSGNETNDQNQNGSSSSYYSSYYSNSSSKAQSNPFGSSSPFSSSSAISNPFAQQPQESVNDSGFVTGVDERIKSVQEEQQRLNSQHQNSKFSSPFWEAQSGFHQHTQNEFWNPKPFAQENETTSNSDQEEQQILSSQLPINPYSISNPYSNQYSNPYSTSTSNPYSNQYSNPYSNSNPFQANKGSFQPPPRQDDQNKFDE